MVTVSVVIPNYNHAPFLEERIKSVLNQTYQDFEIILLDDCSSDNSREILNSHKSHPKVSHVLLNDLNSGSTFKQWKKGADIAIGKFIWIAESDDACRADFLEKMVPLLESDKDIAMTFCQSKKIDEKGHDLGSLISHTSELNHYNWNEDFVADGNGFNLHAMSYMNAVPNASAALISKQYLNEIIKNPVPFRLNGDWYVWIKLISDKKIAYLKEEMNYFRFHTSSVRSSFRDYELIAKEFSMLQKEIYKLTHVRPGKNSQQVLLTGWMYGYILDKSVSFKNKAKSLHQILKFGNIPFSLVLDMFIKDKLLLLKILKS